METITFHCKVITPMFLAGADGQTPELRAPSIKGAMRFWWRALNGHLVKKDEKTGEWDYSKLKEREGKIFGDTKQKSAFDLVVNPTLLNSSSDKLSGKKLILKKWDHKKGKEINIPIDVLEYLCYGVLDYVKGQGNVFNREYIIPDQIFTVELNIRNDSCKDEIVKSFKALSKFGGIGAKSRNGFGSFVIDDIEGVSFKDMQVGNLKPYTCFSKEATLLTTYSEGNWKDVLNELAEVYKKSRESIELKHNYDKRKYLGSPLIVNKVTKSFLERHSKSFIMSIGKSEEGGIKGYVLFLPYLFLEGNELYTEQHGENFDSVSLEFRGLLEEKLVKIS